MPLVNCLECNKEISTESNRCPHCGAPKHKAMKVPTGLKVIGVIFMILGGITILVGGSLTSGITIGGILFFIAGWLAYYGKRV